MKDNIILQKLFVGRINRKHYFFILLIIIVIGLLSIMSNGTIFYPIGKVVALIGHIFFISFSIRRLHDIGISEYYIILLLPFFVGAFVPFNELVALGFIVANIFLLFLLFVPGKKFTNKYGPVPGKRSFIKTVLNKE